jgi:hypothetical protein
MCVVMPMPEYIPVALSMVVMMCLLVHSSIFYVDSLSLAARRFARCWKYDNTCP